MHYQGPLFRALNPIWAKDPLSGEGARRYGGRFNRKGRAALYTSTRIETAIREANQVGSLQPTTLVQFEADLEPVFEATAENLHALGVALETLAADDWRVRMRDDGASPAQGFVENLVRRGYVAMQIRSFAPGAGAKDLNLVLWKWSSAPPTMLRLVDDEDRLTGIH